MHAFLTRLYLACLAIFWSAFLQAGEAGTHPRDINHTYVQLAHAVYQDSLMAAQELQQAIQQLLDVPSEESLLNARETWRRARVPYQQSEVFRFSNALVDDWEGRVNSWPLDEGLIDYVSDDYFYELGNVAAQLNIIANPLIELGSGHLDTRHLTPETLATLNELGGSEANVATGYHAIEFLLWGQDLNGTGPGAGQRPASDFIAGDQCTNGHCQRRAAYLQAAAQLLVDDLSSMVQQWNPETPNNFAARLLTAEPELILAKIFFSMGSLSLGELAGERMKVALEANSTEDEHDCFSDNTHWSHYYDALGIRNLYLGEYRRLDGRLLKGPSAADYAARLAPVQHRQLLRDLNQSVEAVRRIVDVAEDQANPVKFDQMIATGNQQGKQLIGQAIQALVVQTDTLEALAKQLGIDPGMANQL